MYRIFKLVKPTKKSIFAIIKECQKRTAMSLMYITVLKPNKFSTKKNSSIIVYA